jgi:hypothetical protein
MTIKCRNPSIEISMLLGLPSRMYIRILIIAFWYVGLYTTSVNYYLFLAC